jgi:lipid-A-disaccharide synthase
VKVFVLAGEPSGDALGAALMAGLRALVPRVGFSGVGGPQMAGQGLTSLFAMSDLSVMGLAEVAPRYFHLRRRIAQTAQAIVGQRPDVVVTIDSPDFCLRVLARARAACPGLKTVHYVAPSVWAWRPGRAARMAPLVDHVLTLLPFEPPYMQAAGMAATFVGHPVVAQPLATPAQVAAFRAARGIGAAPVILALPGSRASEVTRLAPRFGTALRQVLAHQPEARVVVPAVAALGDLVRAAVADWPGAPVVLVQGQGDGGDKAAAFGAARVALAASGTVSLELARAGVPMVIGYDMAPLSRWLIGRLLQVDTVTLVNLVTQTRAVPEYLGRACQPGPMAAALAALMTDGAARAAQTSAMAACMQALGAGGEDPGMRAARAVLGVAAPAAIAPARASTRPGTSPGPGTRGAP